MSMGEPGKMFARLSSGVGTETSAFKYARSGLRADFSGMVNGVKVGYCLSAAFPLPLTVMSLRSDSPCFLP